MKNLNKIAVSAVALSGLFAGGASAALVTNDVIFGSGVTNGSFTVDQNGQTGVELGLRGKLRHNASGDPENTFNEFSPGVYSFDAGVGPTQSSPTATWSFEWSINTDFSGQFGTDLDDLVYELALDTDPSLSSSFFILDPINDPNAGEVDGHWDHSIGDNTTGQGAGTEATDIASYTALLADNNLAQNSWKPHWFIPGFDPTVDGTYDISLTAFNDDGGEVASTSIQIVVGQGGSAQVPEPASIAMFAAGLLGLGAIRRRKAK